MGRQAYMTRLALGRSPYEPLLQSGSHDSDDELQGQDAEIPENSGKTSTAPNTDPSTGYQQQYDSRGYPENLESKALSSQYRRAHNDIAEMVGNYAGVQAEGQSIKSQLDIQRKFTLDKSALEAVVRENEVGLLVGSADISLLYLCNMCTIGLKHRLQAYRFYSGILLTQILKTEWKHFGVAKFLFAGAPAGLTFIFLDMFSLWAIEEFIQIIARHLLRRSNPRTHKDLKRLLYNSCNLLQLLSFTFLAPLEMFSTLQRLDLVSAGPIYPSFWSFIPLSLSSPVHMPALQDPFSLRSYANTLVSLAVSPLFLWGLIYWMRPSVSRKLYAYMRAALPKPTKPDKYSLQAAKETDLDEDTVPGLYPESSGQFPSNCVLEELARDLQYIGKTFIQVYNRWMWKKETLKPDGIQQSETRSATRPALPDLDVFNTHVRSNEGASDASPSSLSIGSPHPTSPFSYPPTRPTTPGPSVEIVTSFAPASDDGHTIKFLARQPQHRITALTAYAADSMASHVSSHLTDLLFLPLEALFVRSLAIAFLSSPAAGTEAQIAAMRWKREVYPIRGWFGMGPRGGWRGVADYAGKMVLVSGMEVGISMAIWQACTGFSWWCGRTYFGWGRL